MSQDMLHLAVIQDNPTVGAIEANKRLILDHLDREKRADLVIFPECFLTGYPLGDLVLRPGFLADVAEAISDLRREVMERQGPAVLVGAPLAGATLPYNAAYLIEPNGVVRVVRKRELPNNDVFDEVRTFASSDEPNRPLSFRGFNLGIQICEDMWHGRVSRGLADELADVLIVINGSPYQEGKDELRKRIARARMKDTGLPLIYCNLVGGQDELVFEGGSFMANPDGTPVEAGAFAPRVMHLALAREGMGQTRLQLAADLEPSPYPTNHLASDYNAAVLALRDYVGKIGAPHVVVGVSGGLDSALVLTMAVDALGSDRVVGVMMPSEFTSQESLDLAADLMERLEVVQAELPIDAMAKVVSDVSRPVVMKLGAKLDRDPSFGITEENYQARLRGMALMGITNALGGIVLSTGNKSEMSVGYATLYGDMSGGYNPLKSVYKSEAFAMARWRNDQSKLLVAEHCWHDPIPEGIISRPPTAELSDGQTDAASLGHYEMLDHVLKSVIEHRCDAASAARALRAKYSDAKILDWTGGLSAEDYAKKIVRLVRGAQYKRDQSCPGVKLNLTDFGLGWRYPIAGDYQL